MGGTRSAAHLLHRRALLVAALAALGSVLLAPASAQDAAPLVAGVARDLVLGPGEEHHAFFTAQAELPYQLRIEAIALGGGAGGAPEPCSLHVRRGGEASPS
eukprot:CAMPEP_0182879628 /NCGR_PEP_ID=MMETSP0034_2-20130328/16097_1 /TAXON_ID=156128 /ORGANISM="Nephroselmis pyriformis, Strain CCMP717" /LENGTH=101 /DNA_ID=CAMNT_0025012583 /DNA_START=121 /DNA_END=423 /DNA_ORIENTATION=-